MAGFGPNAENLKLKPGQGWGGKSPTALGTPAATPQVARSGNSQIAGATYATPTTDRRPLSTNRTMANTVSDKNPFQGGAATNAAPGNPYGTESGPGILESWFNQRATGTDPAYEYAMKRGMEDLGNRSAAAGSFNSGAARQQESDFAANLGAQRMGTLDALAGGASGEHQGRLNSMFSQGQAIAGGQAGTMGAYDLASANSNNALMNAIVQMMGGKAGVDDKARQGFLNNIFGGASLFAGSK